MEWRPISEAPKDGTPVLVSLSKRQVRNRDGWHGRLQVAANRGRGWVSIPGLWSCEPVSFMPLPPPPTGEDG